MNEIKRQLLTEIKKRTDGNIGKDIPLGSKKFPFKGKTVEDMDAISQRGTHRGKISSAELPTTYRFKPTAFNKKTKKYSGNKEAGSHVYTIKTDEQDVNLEIIHSKSNSSGIKKGSLTTSKVNINFGDKPASLEILNSVVPSLKHHIKAVSPDTLSFKVKGNRAFFRKVVDEISKGFRISSDEKIDGTNSYTLQSKKITPKIQSLINNIIQRKK